VSVEGVASWCNAVSCLLTWSFLRSTRFVEYFDLRHAQTALEKAGSLTLQGHELEVRQAHSPR
jgi:hypothetical protein